MSSRSIEEIEAMTEAIKREWNALGDEDEYGDSTQPRKKMLRLWLNDLRHYQRGVPLQTEQVELWLEGRPSLLDDIEVE